MSANDELQAHACEKMLEFYGNVANNVAQPETQDLIELVAGKKYYVMTSYSDKAIIAQAVDLGDKIGFHSYKMVKQVLAPVPSYDKWQATERKAKKYDNIKVNGNYPDKISKLKSRIKSLTELLKACREILEDEGYYTTICQIDEVLK